MLGGAAHLVELFRLRLVGGIAAQDVGEADDGIHRCADFVAHVGQEGALGPVGGLCRIACLGHFPGAGGDQFFQVVAVACQFLVGHLALGNVEIDAEHPYGPALVRHDPAARSQPAYLAIGADDAVLDFEGITARHVVQHLLLDLCNIIWMNAGQPGVLRAIEAVRRQAIELFRLGRPPGLAGVEIDAPEADTGCRLGDLQALLAGGQAFLDQLALGDVGPHRRQAQGIAYLNRLDRNPEMPPVAVLATQLALVAAAARGDKLVDARLGRSAIGVDLQVMDVQPGELAARIAEVVAGSIVEFDDFQGIDVDEQDAAIGLADDAGEDFLALAQGFGGRLQRGDVLHHADGAAGCAVVVPFHFGALGQPFQRAANQGPMFDMEHAGLPGAVPGLPDLATVAGGNELEELAWREGGAERNVEQAVSLLGADQGIEAEIVDPAADLGDVLRPLQCCLAIQQFTVRHVLRGDVAADAENADQAAIGAANGHLEYLDQFAVTVGEGAPFLFGDDFLAFDGKLVAGYKTFCLIGRKEVVIGLADQFGLRHADKGFEARVAAHIAAVRGLEPHHVGHAAQELHQLLLLVLQQGFGKIPRLLRFGELQGGMRGVPQQEVLGGLQVNPVLVAQPFVAAKRFEGGRDVGQVAGGQKDDDRPDEHGRQVGLQRGADQLALLLLQVSLPGLDALQRVIGELFVDVQNMPGEMRMHGLGIPDVAAGDRRVDGDDVGG